MHDWALFILPPHGSSAKQFHGSFQVWLCFLVESGERNSDASQFVGGGEQRPFVSSRLGGFFCAVGFVFHTAAFSFG
jgi:hypothetical protein